MLQKYKKILLILTVGIAILFLVLIFFLAWTISRSKHTVLAPSPLPTPPKGLAAPKLGPTLRQEAQTIKEKITQTDKKSGDLILYDNDNLTIRYLILNDEFIISIKKAPYEKNKKEAEDWFKNKGFNNQDLCLLRISFGTSKTIKPDFSVKDATPSGCPVPTIEPLIAPKR